MVPLFAVLTILVTLAIPAGAIDHERARGLDRAGEHVAGWRVLAERRPLVVLAGAVALFHFATRPCCRC